MTREWTHFLVVMGRHKGIRVPAESVQNGIVSLYVKQPVPDLFPYYCGDKDPEMRVIAVENYRLELIKVNGHTYPFLIPSAVQSEMIALQIMDGLCDIASQHAELP